MASDRSVLIVDGSAENREVLQTVLERRGFRAFSADRIASGLELARSQEPDLIVLDLETVDAASVEVAEPLMRPTGPSRPSVVMLGTLRGRTTSESGGEPRPSANLAKSEAVCVPKPYHYGPLIRKIEELLAASEQASVAPA